MKYVSIYEMAERMYGLRPDHWPSAIQRPDKVKDSKQRISIFVIIRSSSSFPDNPDFEKTVEFVEKLDSEFVAAFDSRSKILGRIKKYLATYGSSSLTSMAAPNLLIDLAILQKANKGTFKEIEALYSNFAAQYQYPEEPEEQPKASAKPSIPSIW